MTFKPIHAPPAIKKKAEGSNEFLGCGLWSYEGTDGPTKPTWGELIYIYIIYIYIYGPYGSRWQQFSYWKLLSGGG